jgi:hypothetical protein
MSEARDEEEVGLSKAGCAQYRGLELNSLQTPPSSQEKESHIHPTSISLPLKNPTDVKILPFKICTECIPPVAIR